MAKAMKAMKVVKAMKTAKGTKATKAANAMKAKKSMKTTKAKRTGALVKATVARKQTLTVTDNSTGRTHQIPFPGGTLEAADVHRAISVLAPSSLSKMGSRKNTLNHVLRQRVQFIGAPFAEGQNLIGTELCAQAMRDAGMKEMVEKLSWKFLDDGDLVHKKYNLAQKELLLEKYRAWIASGTSDTFSKWSSHKIRTDVHVSHTKPKGDPYKKVANAAVIGKGNRLVYEKVKAASSVGDFVLTIGGDHSIASGTIGALVETYPQLGVIWVDAHADANTPDTSPSNHYHGMPAAHVMGWFKKQIPGFEWLKSKLPQGQLAYIGLRDIDPEEGRLLQDSGVHVFTMAHVDRMGIAQCVALALERIDPYHNRPLHLTFDVDAIDPVYAPGTGTLARGGLTYRESHYICEELAASNRLIGMDLVEVNPLVDHLPEQMHGDDPSLSHTSMTVGLGIELALSALGKNILNTDVWRLPHFSGRE